MRIEEVAIGAKNSIFLYKSARSKEMIKVSPKKMKIRRLKRLELTCITASPTRKAAAFSAAGALTHAVATPFRVLSSIADETMAPSVSVYHALRVTQIPITIAQMLVSPARTLKIRSRAWLGPPTAWGMPATTTFRAPRMRTAQPIHLG